MGEFAAEESGEHGLRMRVRRRVDRESKIDSFLRGRCGPLAAEKGRVRSPAMARRPRLSDGGTTLAKPAPPAPSTQAKIRITQSAAEVLNYQEQSCAAATEFYAAELGKKTDMMKADVPWHLPVSHEEKVPHNPTMPPCVDVSRRPMYAIQFQS